MSDKRYDGYEDEYSEEQSPELNALPEKRRVSFK